MSQIFISYSRKDLAIAEKIINALAKDELEPWVDWKSIPKGEEFESEIYRGIEESDIFLFLVSPDSVQSDWCNIEITHAVKNGKRLIPIVIRDTNPQNIHPKISKRNWIFCRDGHDDFNKTIEETRKTIHTDYDWLKYHTKLQVKALEWEHQQDNSRLLRSKELQDAEQQLANAGNQKDPQPTTLQRQYLLKSRRYADYMRRTVTWSSVSVAIIMILLSLVAWGQRNSAISAQNTAVAEANAKATALVNVENARATAQAEKERAEEQAHIAISRQLTSLARTFYSNQLNMALLLSVEANNVQKTLEARSSLLDVLQYSPHLLAYLNNHSEKSVTIAFSPDGRILATGNDNGSIALWDMATYQMLGTPIVGDSSYTGALAFSPDGRALVSEGDSHKILLWDVSTHQQIAPPISTSHEMPIVEIVYSPDGKLLASRSRDSTILWNTGNYQPIGQPLPTYSYGSGIAFSPDSKTIAIGDVGFVQLWDVSTHQLVGQPFVGTTQIFKVAFSPDGTILAAGGNGVMMWDVSTRQPRGEPLSSGWQFSFSPNGKTIATSSSSRDSDGIIIWDVTAHQPIDKYQGSNIWDITYSPDGKILVSIGSDGIILWDTTASPPLSEQLSGKDSKGVFSPTQEILATYGNAGSLTIWDMTTHQPIDQPFITPSGNVTSIAFSTDGKFMAAGDDNSNITLWDVASHKVLKTFTSESVFPVKRVVSIAFSPDNKYLVAGSVDESLSIWDLTTDQKPMYLLVGYSNYSGPLIDIKGKSSGSVMDVAFSPNGKILASVNFNGVTLWDVAKLQPIGQPLVHQSPGGNISRVNCIAFSSDGKILASGSDDSSIILWDLTTLQPLRQPLVGHTGYIYSVAFSPNGKTLASWSNDGTIRLWDVGTHQPVGQPLLSTGQNVVFSPDGKLLFSGGVLWHIDLQYWMSRACQIVGRNFNQAEWNRFLPEEPYRITCPQWPAGE